MVEWAHYTAVSMSLSLFGSMAAVSTLTTLNLGATAGIERMYGHMQVQTRLALNGLRHLPCIQQRNRSRLSPMPFVIVRAVAISFWIALGAAAPP